MFCVNFQSDNYNDYVVILYIVSRVSSVVSKMYAIGPFVSSYA